MKQFRLGTEVRIGHEALAALDEFAHAPVLLVTDEFLSTTQPFAGVLQRLGPEVSVFKEVVPNPTVATISQGVARYLAAGPEVVVAYGGGSVLDAAKGMHKAALDSGFGAPGGIVAIPTTSGSGSEVTSFAVITDEQSHAKIPLVSTDMVARLAILDPDVVVGVPPRITADSGMDVLTHAVEACVSLEACDFSDALAEKAVELVFAHLPRCYTHGDDREARGHMHNASCLAAMAFDNVGLGITHSLAHALGGRFDVAHGRLNAILLPHVIEFNAEHSDRAKERYARLGRILAPSATGRAAVTTLIGAVRRLNTALGIPERLTGLDVVDTAALQEQIDAMVAAAAEDTCTRTNPVQPRVDDLRAILLAAI
ncbi:1-propanol dehydrogenase PduQ [Tessaracoccus massiliensis]|uniref:1-propanol dehydrogenase PduQ n=1 Tax=Tessaracoccus massiliensis TaxID=1522311 RepID=UPI00058B67F8|nr:1-propanol dehydrogenase PduQ [Tessaracoccus massiliensis]